MELFRHHKDRAAAFLARGKKKHALKEYRAALEANPGDIQVRQKLADLLLRLGYDDAAIREYQSVAGKYAADGFLVKAMAICKVILRIDPNHTETQAVLAELFATQNPNAVLPPSMTAALAGPSLRVTPARVLGTRATRSELPAVDPQQGYDLPHARPAPAPEPPPPRPEPAGLKLEELEAALVARATPGLDVEMQDEDAPHTLVPGIFGSEEMPATLEAPALASSDADLYLELDDEDDVSGDLDLGAESTNVDTAELAVDLSDVAPIPLFSQLDKQAFIALLERLKVKSTGAAERLITEGQTTRTMYVVAQGEVRVFRETAVGQVELARLGEGSFFGEIALLSSSPRMASVETTAQTILLEMTREDVAEIVKRHPSVTDVLSRFYRERFLANLVRSNPMLFAPLSDEEKRAVFQHFQSVTVPKGTVLLQKGEMGQGLYLILRGECDVIETTGDGREVLLPTLREGDFFGEMSLLLNSVVTATVRARTTCVVLLLPREIFYEKVMKHPEVRRVITEVTNERLKQVVNAQFAADDPVLL